MDEQPLENLYEGSIYKEMPKMVKWAFRVVPERIIVVEERRTRKILASVYTDVCGYRNLWSSYLAFDSEKAGKMLVDFLLKTRRERGLRNLYVFCPKEFVNMRVHLIARGFVSEGIRKIDGIEYIVENHNGTFYPVYRIVAPKEALPINIRKAESMDLNVLAKILHENLPRDIASFEDAVSDVRRWLKEMPECIIVAEHNNLPIGVIFLSLETFPVLDKTLAMLCYIAVDRRFRGRGVGETLIKEACNFLRKKGKSSMEVDVSVHNISARIFYTKAGFYPFWFSRNYMPHDDGIFYRIDF